MTRIARYMKNNAGGHNLGVRVLGGRILIEADADNQDRADLLARMISDLGPEDITPSPPPVVSIAEKTEVPVRKRDFVKGERVWCNVYGAEGWTTVVEVGEGRNRGRIKIVGERMWCPVHNFDREARR